MAKRSAVALLKAEQRELQARLDNISQAISLLGGESPFPRAKTLGKKRGRKKAKKAAKKRKMSAAARKAVSKRMKAYWAKKRKGGKK